MIVALRWVSALLCLYMIAVVVQTSLQSNLFEVWHELGQIPWMVATLKDFYINVAAIALWVFYRERKMIWRWVWLVLLVCLGSIATMAYLFIALMRLKPGDELSALFLRPVEAN